MTPAEATLQTAEKINIAADYLIHKGVIGEEKFVQLKVDVVVANSPLRRLRVAVAMLEMADEITNALKKTSIDEDVHLHKFGSQLLMFLLIGVLGAVESDAKRLRAVVEVGLELEQ